MRTLLLTLATALFLLPLPARSQVNSGSNGSDGALNPTANLVIDMADHPDGIYHYTGVNIPVGVTVTFLQNVTNTPVVWLVQGDCIVSGIIEVSGRSGASGVGGQGGPGGYRGGSSGSGSGIGQGPGGGNVGGLGGNASFATVGGKGTYTSYSQVEPGEIYGTKFNLPLIGGSGGGAGDRAAGGGGGAIMIASNNLVKINGLIIAAGGNGDYGWNWPSAWGGGAGSGGSVRVVSQVLSGTGSISVIGGYSFASGGDGRIRVDVLENLFQGSLTGNFTQGFQPVILAPVNQAVTLSIQSVGGIAVVQAPGGKLTSPDVIVPAAQQNPVSIVVGCMNIPLGTEIIVDLKPAIGPAIRTVGLNNIGNQASSTATIQVQMPRGGGTIQAKSVSGIQLAANDDPNAEHLSIAQTGWTADGERFKSVEVTAGLGTSSQIAYLTESGKRYTLTSR